MRSQRSFLRKRGFTLVELVVAMTIVSVVVTILAGTFVTNADIFRSTVRSNDEISELRLAAARIALEIRSILDKTSIKTANSKMIKFVNTDGDEIDIKFTPGKREISINKSVLATGVSSFELRYFDKSGNPMKNPKTNPQTNIWSIEIELQTTGQTGMKMVSRAYPRNFI